MMLGGSTLPSGHAAHGVAIGLGLLSSALSDPECDVKVTGTIVKDGIQEDWLEVVFSLREVRDMDGITCYNVLTVRGISIPALL